MSKSSVVIQKLYQILGAQYQFQYSLLSCEYGEQLNCSLELALLWFVWRVGRMCGVKATR